MRLDRSISAGPRHGVEQTCASIANFVTGILNERAYPDTARVQKGFEAIFPTLRYLLTTRKFAEPAISVQMPELIARISVSYDVDAEDNLEVPSLVLLEKLPQSATVKISLHSAGEVPESLRVPLDKASSQQISFTLAAGLPAGSGDADDGFDDTADANIVPPEEDAETVPPEEDAASGDPVVDSE